MSSDSIILNTIDTTIEGITNDIEQQSLTTMERLHVGESSDEHTGEAPLTVKGDTIINGTLYTRHIADEDLYIQYGTHTILPHDGYRIIYADSTNGAVNIMLGSQDNHNFERNRRITIKDVSLEIGDGSAYNVNIIVPNCGTRIEYYRDGVLTAGVNAGYVINTNGGAVTLRYFMSSIPNVGTWVIESQFIGQATWSRSLATTSNTNK